MSENFPGIPSPPPASGHYWVYILQTADSSLYIGQTCNVPERLRKHRLGLGAKHTHDHAKPQLIYCEAPTPLREAVAREQQLKRWSRAKKEALIRGDRYQLRNLSRSRD